MTLHQSIPNGSPLMDGLATSKKSPPRVVSASHDIQEIPAAAPLSTYPSEGAMPPKAPVICITGKFSNIERHYHVNSSRVLGTGHHGSVFECVRRGTGDRFAVKSVRKANPNVKPAGLAREILLLREMNHQSIVRIVDVYEDEEHVHLVTTLCEGGELFDKIVERSSNDGDHPCFLEDEAARIMYQILEAVSYMHQCCIVHRDIKPENVLFKTAQKGSSIKIVDFGISRIHRECLELPMSTLVGTPYYIAPEVLRKGYGKSCDLWSVGVIAYVILCGYPPFNGKDDDQTHRAVLKGQYYFPAEDWEGISGEAMDFIHRLLQMDPRRRMTAEQGKTHPWITKYVTSNAVTNDEEHQQMSKRHLVQFVDRPRSPVWKVRVSDISHSETLRKRPVQYSSKSPRSPVRKVRASMFVF